MAQLFAGGAATDNILTDYTGTAAQRTYSIWLYLTSQPADISRRFLCKDAAGGGATEIEMSLEATNVLQVLVYFSAGSAFGQWHVTMPSVTTWHHFAVAYDSGSTANDPVIYIDGVSQTVTEITAPTGTADTGAGPVRLGNRSSSQNRCFPGALAEFAIHDALFTGNEVAALARGILPWRIRTPAVYYPLWGVHSPEIDLSPWAGTATVTGATKTNHPPVQLWTMPARAFVPQVPVGPTNEDSLAMMPSRQLIMWP